MSINQNANTGALPNFRNLGILLRILVIVDGISLAAALLETSEPLPLMEARGGGSVVNLLSPGAFHYMPEYSAVGVTKAALSSLTMYLAVELAPRGVRVNAVSAGWVEGSEGEHSYRDEVSDRVRPHVPAGRNVQPQDVAAAVAWVVSDQAPMLIGQTIHLDGGFADAAWSAVLGE